MRSFTEPRARLRALARRRHQAGAAFVESLIVISMIMLVLFAVLWLQAVYSAKLQTIQAARANAWGTALAGCVGLEDSNTMLQDAVSQSNAEGSRGSDGAGNTQNNGDTQGTVGGLRADSQGNDSPGWFDLRDAAPATQSVDFGGFKAGTNMHISTTRHFQCNERSNPKELELSAGDLFSNLASIVRDLFN